MEGFRRLTRALRAPWHRREALAQLRAFHAGSPGLDEVVRWTLQTHGRGNFKVGTQQVEQEILWLARKVAALEPRSVLEIGTARGGTLFIWAHLASQRVVSCDIAPPGSRRALLEAFPPPGSACRVILEEGSSHDPAFRARVTQDLGGEPVDFLFIDGDHTEAGVEADYQDYRGLVRPGGLIAFHDIAERQVLGSNQVQHFWRRLKTRIPVEECIADPAQVGYGIGVVRAG